LHTIRVCGIFYNQLLLQVLYIGNDYLFQIVQLSVNHGTKNIQLQLQIMVNSLANIIYYIANFHKMSCGLSPASSRYCGTVKVALPKEEVYFPSVLTWLSYHKNHLTHFQPEFGFNWTTIPQMEIESKELTCTSYCCLEKKE